MAALIVAAAGAAMFIGKPAGTAVGDAGTTAAPSFMLPGLRPGEPVVSIDDAPGRPTVVNFFAAWCAPCKRELPALRDAATREQGRVVFVGIDHQDSREDAIDLLDELGVTYAAGYDPRGDVAARYGVRGLPATAFVTADGRLLELHQGELSSRALAAAIRRLTLRSGT